MLVGVFLIGTAGGAAFLDERVPGVVVPPEVRDAFAAASDPRELGMTVARRMVEWAVESHSVRRVPAGIHIMSLNRFDEVATLAGGLR
ncbi:MAG: hypothetical protein Kow00129_04330 [Thermoleophilia bacterium]